MCLFSFLLFPTFFLYFVFRSDLLFHFFPPPDISLTGLKALKIPETGGWKFSTCIDTKHVTTYWLANFPYLHNLHHFDGLYKVETDIYKHLQLLNNSL